LNEIYGNGCGASGDSLQQISRALLRTKEWLGIVPDANWTGKLYQSANRYAHLHFLRGIAGIEAYLVNVYFIADPHSPTSLQDWSPAIDSVERQLGLAASVPFAGKVFLNAMP
jgi:hypothetical protein